ncbi:glycoside hydrolase family 3 N-terminal domain-containing protein, partial [Acidobacteriota bacterium]
MIMLKQHSRNPKDMNIKNLALKALPTITILLLAGCATKMIVEPKMTYGPDEAKWVRKTLENMTIEEKIGQMIACRCTVRFMNGESESLGELKTLVREQKVGGFVLFGGDVFEAAHLNNTLQETARIPLLIASDLERGLGNQIDGAILFPPAMSYGAADSEELAYTLGKITAREARAVGIHMTYAPVVDVNINPDNPIINVRSFGEDPDQVSRLAVAFLLGCQEHGLITAAKHFPGHGDTAEDSHLVLPTLEFDRNRLDKVELYPYRKTIESGLQAIMIAHLWIPSLDATPDLPASLSRPVVTDLLRKEMGFKGLLVTDAMDMHAVTKLYSSAEAALMAVKAGIDMVLLPPEPKKVIERLVRAVKSGEIAESSIDASVKRILDAKARIGLHKQKLVDLEALDDEIDTRVHRRQAEIALESSMTLVKNGEDIIPLPLKGKKLTVLSLSSDKGGYFAGKRFVDEMRKRVPEAFTFYAEATTGKEYLEDMLEKTVDTDIFIIGIFSRLRGYKGSVGLEEKHVDLIQKLAGSNKKVVAVSFSSPYFLRHFPDVDSYLCAYRYSSGAQATAVKALFGEIAIQGKLPVSIPGLYPFG